MAKKQRNKGSRDSEVELKPLHKSCMEEQQRAREVALKAHEEADLSKGPVKKTITFTSLYTGGDRQENIVLHPTIIQHENGLTMARIH